MSDDSPKYVGLPNGLPIPPGLPAWSPAPSGPASLLDLPMLDDLPPLPPPTSELLAQQAEGSTAKKAKRNGSIPVDTKTKLAQAAAEAVAAEEAEATAKAISAGEPGLPIKRKRGRKPGVPASLPSTGILTRVAQGRTGAFDVGNGKKGHIATDDEVSADAWQKVYEAFGETGSMAEISRMTGVSRSHISHLLDYGIMRLGLPPIREHATDFEEVNLRTNALVKASNQPSEAEFLQNLPDIKKAVTERATREAAVAQGLLHSSMRTVDVFLGYVNEIMQKMQEPDGGFLIPVKVTVAHIETLSKTANNLSRALDTAVRLSRFTAGEPEHNIALTLSHLVTQMTPDELRSYLKTRQLPKHIVNPSGASLTPADEKQLPSVPRIIDIESSDDGEPNGQ